MASTQWWHGVPWGGRRVSHPVSLQCPRPRAWDRSSGFLWGPDAPQPHSAGASPCPHKEQPSASLHLPCVFPTLRCTFSRFRVRALSRAFLHGLQRANDGPRSQLSRWGGSITIAQGHGHGDSGGAGRLTPPGCWLAFGTAGSRQPPALCLTAGASLGLTPSRAGGGPPRGWHAGPSPTAGEHVSILVAVLAGLAKERRQIPPRGGRRPIRVQPHICSARLP